MNNIHNNGENDQSLKDGLDELGRAYGQLPLDEPPDLLDQAILNSAHRAVEKKPHWMKFGWLHGLTTTAVFVLAFSLILNQSETVPVYDDAIGPEESIGASRQIRVKKQATDIQADTAQMEKKEKSILRQDSASTMPVAAPQSPSAENRMEESVMAVQPSLNTRDTNLGKTDSDNRETSIIALESEEQMISEADMSVDLLEVETATEKPFPAAAAKSVSGEVETANEPNFEAEQKLQVIIRLKQNGNETWKAELEIFKESYPDYPLPEVLQN
jgi:hypothetical protein